jgi:hypothetical protein
MLLQEHIISQDKIIEHAHAQLMLQELHSAKQRASLWVKEHKTKANRVIAVFTQLGQRPKFTDFLLRDFPPVSH